MKMHRIRSIGFVCAVAIISSASLYGLISSVTSAQVVDNQQPQKWEGACARCGEGYSWFGPIRPINNRCNRFVNNAPCNGAIIWQPVF
jgi:hypothetical protein